VDAKDGNKPNEASGKPSETQGSSDFRPKWPSARLIIAIVQCSLGDQRESTHDNIRGFLKKLNELPKVVQSGEIT